MDSINSDKAKIDEIKRKAALAKAAAPAPQRKRSRDPVKEPLLSKILYVFAIASIIIGFALYKGSWSSDAAGVAFLIWGCVQGALFASIGLALTYLKGIYENTRDA